LDDHSDKGGRVKEVTYGRASLMGLRRVTMANERGRERIQESKRKIFQDLAKCTDEPPKFWRENGIYAIPQG